MDLCVLLRIFSIACAALFVVHVLLLMLLSKSQGMDRLVSETGLAAKWMRVTTLAAPVLLMLYWMGSYENVRLAVMDSLIWFLGLDFILFLLVMLFRLAGMFRLRSKGGDAFREMMGRTAGYMTASMLLTVVAHFFLQGVAG